MFIDKFDILLSHENHLFELLDALATIKNQRTDNYGLQAFVIVGTNNIIQHTTAKRSAPFSMFEHLQAPNFSVEQVKGLFSEFTASCGVILEPGIVERIYYITSGHPGMVNVCGKMLQEEVLRNSNTLSLKDWKSYELLHLARYISLVSLFASDLWVVLLEIR